MKYVVFFSKSALKELLKIPNSEIGRILEKIDLLTIEHRPLGAKKLKGGIGALWRIRVGD